MASATTRTKTFNTSPFSPKRKKKKNQNFLVWGKKPPNPSLLCQLDLSLPLAPGHMERCKLFRARVPMCILLRPRELCPCAVPQPVQQAFTPLLTLRAPVTTPKHLLSGWPLLPQVLGINGYAINHKPGGQGPAFASSAPHLPPINQVSLNVL